MEIKYIEKKVKNNNYSFTIKDNEINGIVGKDFSLIKSILSLYDKESVMINKKYLNEEGLNEIRNKISYINIRIDIRDYYLTCYDLLIREIKERNLELRNPEKKIIDSLKIVGLDKILLERRISTLSQQEKKLLLLAISLLSNPELIIIEEPFIDLDLKSEKKMMLLLQKIKEQYNKTIIFISKSTDYLYQYTSHLILINNGVIKEGKTEEIIKNIDLLKDNNFEIPEIVEFTSIVRNNKKVKIDYHKDIRDIIKDIYKHV